MTDINLQPDSTLYRSSKAEAVVQVAVAVVFSLLLLTVLGVCTFLSSLEYGRKEYCLQYSNAAVHIAIGVAAFALLFTALRLLCSRIKHIYVLTAVLSVVLFGIQLFAAHAYYFETDWDAGMVTYFASVIHEGGSHEYIHTYFSRYPNNLLLGRIFAYIYSIVDLVGLEGHELFVIITINAFINCITGFLLACVIQKLLGKSYLTLFGYVIYAILIGMSPWISIPYSDSLGLFMPTLIVFLYLHREVIRSNFVFWFAVSFIGYISLQIKPQLYIIVIAVTLMEIVRAAGDIKNKKNIGFVLGFALGSILAVILTKYLISTLHFDRDYTMGFGLPHFFMMGMNQEEMGVYSLNDELFSCYVPNVHDRNIVNMEQAFSRIKDMGFAGTLTHLCRKALTNFNDGTFCWSGEGRFYVQTLNPEPGALGDFFKKLYYNRELSHIGIYFNAWSNCEQTVWMATMFCAFLSFIKKADRSTTIVRLALVGLIVFELLFEARARYIYTYVPLFILMAVCGADAVSGVIEKVVKSREDRKQQE